MSHISIGKKLKLVDQDTKDLTLGFIHQHEREYNLISIPLLISYLCLFYFWIKEYFKECTNDIEIYDEKKSIKRITPYADGISLALANILIPGKWKVKAIWTFKLQTSWDFWLDAWGPIIYKIFWGTNKTMTKQLININMVGTNKQKNVQTCKAISGWLKHFNKTKVWNKLSYKEQINYEWKIQKIILNTKTGDISLVCGDSQFEHLIRKIKINNTMFYKLGITFFDISTSIILQDFDIFDLK